MPKGGKREGAGRKPAPIKQQGIRPWVQVNDEREQSLVESLTPEQRRDAIMQYIKQSNVAVIDTTQPGAYRITPPYRPRGFAKADVVIVNDAGAWLGEYDPEAGAQHYDLHGDYVPAPKGWRKRVVEQVE